jgi:aspartyl-tRNA(Asn)/glutamyl-tRNA(Gln) amidotransferase subunit B
MQETRGFDDSDSSTYSIRTKEDEDDYRYFPEPDLPPFLVSDELIEKIKEEIPPLQQAIKESLQTEFGLNEYDASLLADDMELNRFFLDLSTHTANYKAAANWTIGPIKNYLVQNEKPGIDLKAESIAEIISMVDKGKVSYGMAVQQLFPVLTQNPATDIAKYAEEKGLSMQTGGNELDEMIEKALTKHSQKITEYKKGKKGLVSLFVGEVMKLSGGRADAKLVTEKIIEKLKSN